MEDIFSNNETKLSNLICHSGGATGSDTYFEEIGKEYGVITKAYSYKTFYHNSTSKVEISDEDFLEGIKQINIANKIMKRYNTKKYINLLARNWCQVKYSDEIFAIGTILDSKQKNSKGYYNNSNIQIVDGGTGYASTMAIINNKPLYVFDQQKNGWFKWSYISNKFILLKNIPKISKQNFTGIGTREIKDNGINAIKNLYKNTFEM
jgi:hypothetical protein